MQKTARMINFGTNSIQITKQTMKLQPGKDVTQRDKIQKSVKPERNVGRGWS